MPSHLLACSLANTTCAIINIMTALIFIIVSWLHAFFLVVVVPSSLMLVVVAVNACFQHDFVISNERKLVGSCEIDRKLFF